MLFRLDGFWAAAAQPFMKAAGKVTCLSSRRHVGSLIGIHFSPSLSSSFGGLREGGREEGSLSPMHVPFMFLSTATLEIILLPLTIQAPTKVEA